MVLMDRPRGTKEGTAGLTGLDRKRAVVRWDVLAARCRALSHVSRTNASPTSGSRSHRRRCRSNHGPPAPDPHRGGDHGEGRPPDRGLHRWRRRCAESSTRRCPSRSPPSTRRCGTSGAVTEQRRATSAPSRSSRRRVTVNPSSPPLSRRAASPASASPTVFGALAQIAPDRVFACEVGGDTGELRRPRCGEPALRVPRFLFVLWGWPSQTAWTPAQQECRRPPNNLIEVIESEYPLLIERSTATCPTGCRPGKFRGGLAIARQYRFPQPNGHAPAPHRPTPLPARRLRRAGAQAPVEQCRNRRGRGTPSKCTLRSRRSDVFRHLLAGPGGAGQSPRSRPGAG